MEGMVPHVLAGHHAFTVCGGPVAKISKKNAQWKQEEVHANQDI